MLNVRWLICSLLFCVASATYCQILIFTYAYNRPDFIEMQCKTFKKFLLDEYEFIVFNDATDPILFDGIADMCTRYEIQCISIPQSIHNRLGMDPGAPSVRNSDVVDYSLQEVGYNHNDIIVLMDSDLFLTKPLRIRDYMQGYALAGLHQQRDQYSYLWIGLAFINMRILPDKSTLNFDCCALDGMQLDAGGRTYHYLSSHPELPIRYFSQCYPEDIICDSCKVQDRCCLHRKKEMSEYGFDQSLIRLVESGAREMDIFCNGSFVHYRGGTNWAGKSASYHQRKGQLLEDFLKDLLDE
jgi:hypothetical protein